MHRDRTLGGGPKTVVIVPPQGGLLSERPTKTLCGHPAKLGYASCLVGDAKARKEKHSTEQFVHAALHGD